MDTVVLLSPGPSCGVPALAFGEPLPGSSDAAARFEPGCLVALVHDFGRPCNTYVFRTIPRPTRTAAAVPGVSRAVQLLLHTRSRLACSRLRNMLLRFAKTGPAPESLSDTFWSRLNAVLNGRIRGRAHLPFLLAHETLA